ncbi:MAG: peptide-methionine (S)-S-oxide reductase MsrA [Chloroflexi bacterium]|nr:peptide-methionine (S)-S-oxide reductase MsrA [Chloroflexota bacterium]
MFSKPSTMPSPDEALPGRYEPILPVPGPHAVLGTPIAPPYPTGLQIAEFALGCFWGEEKTFWEQPGVYTTAVGYQGGITPNPTYEEVCSGKTGQAESVRVVFDPAKISYDELLRIFWESHDPTQGMRQGNDLGTQYRSVIFARNEVQRAAAEASRTAFQERLREAGYGTITTEIVGPPAPEFYFAEDYHQQYLKKIPHGYCPNHSTGVTLPEGFAATPLQYIE